ncbi:hypothetical protein AB44_4532 [Escherichia coli 3-073-06_S1_C2]|nr:hypothetical protein AB44_4532 [Escherichia coli 3-073-06_S1_C2]
MESLPKNADITSALLLRLFNQSCYVLIAEYDVHIGIDL